MNTPKNKRQVRHRTLLEVSGLDLDTPGGRPLFRNLNLVLERESVAVIGRNGVGKSSLLQVLAGNTEPQRGKVMRRVAPWLVPQDLPPTELAATKRELLGPGHTRVSAVEWENEFAAAGLPTPDELARWSASRGQARKVQLVLAKLRQPELLLLDEPTRDLDEHGAAWLGQWLEAWPGGLVVVSHDRRVLERFQHFFIVAESGCRYLQGSRDELERVLEQDNTCKQRRYVRNLHVLAEREEHNATVCRRRQRKKNVGRLRELARSTPRMRLNKKRSYAQVSQGRVAKVREDRIAAARGWAKATRRALSVTLPLQLFIPQLPSNDRLALISLERVSVTLGGRTLFEDLDLRLHRDRIAVIGPNGAGKTTLLQVMLGHRAPTAGKASRRAERIGEVAQGATNWRSEESLLAHLARVSAAPSPSALARTLVAHQFPLALAERPMASLSPGERVRAALICLFQRSPAVELLVLDEPTDCLDLVGASALGSVLRAWPGGLVVASHDQGFLATIDFDRRLVLGGQRELVSCVRPLER